MIRNPCPIILTGKVPRLILLMILAAWLSSCAAIVSTGPGPDDVRPVPSGLYADILKWEKVPPDSPDYTRARADIREAEKKLKAQVDGRVRTATDSLAAGNIDSALKAFRAAARMDPRRDDLRDMVRKIPVSKKLIARHTALREKKALDGDWLAVLEEDDIMLTILPGYGPVVSHKKETESRIRKLVAEYFDEAGRKQKDGDSKGARSAFMAVLSLDPSHKEALQYFWASRTLMEQPVLPPTTEFLVHVIKRGESISLLADRYYGDKFKFPIIASFNNMDDPTKVEIGQEIKIPKLDSGFTSPGSAGLPSTSSSDSSDYTMALLDQARMFLKEKDYSESISEAEKFLKEYPDNKDAREILVESYYSQGLLYYQNKFYERALDFFNKVMEMIPDYRDIQAMIEKARNALNAWVDELYKEGIILYRDQILEGALKKWEEVLKLDPDHEGALKYSEKARQLIEKLKEMEKN